MARPTSWIRHVESFVDSSRSSEQQKASVNAIAELVMNDSLTLEGLVKELDLYLTTTDSVIRARGILLLAEILTLLTSKPLHHTIIRYLIGFFTSRLADWQALQGALVGCLALLRRKKDVGSVMGNDASTLAQSFLQNVQVQSLALHDRKLCFELYRCLLDMHPQDVATLGEDMVHGVCAAIDQEKDPQCLMDAFHIVKVLAQLYPDPSGPVGKYANELFEILSCYFPVFFTQEDAGVAREELSEALMQAFSASPFFEEFVIPLLLDKLSSSLHFAKLDSLKYLKSCIKCYGANRMSKHVGTLWLSLKDVIFHLSLKSIEEKDSQSFQIAEESLACLRAAIFEFNNSGEESFANLIINDEDIEMVYQCMSEESQLKIIAVAKILSELIKVSNSSCNKVMNKYFPRLMNILGITTNDSLSSTEMTYDERLNFGALFLTVELLSSCRDLAITVIHTEWCSLLQNSSVSLVHSFGWLLRSSISGERDRKMHIRDASLLVKGLQILATFPQTHLQLSKSNFENILNNIMTTIIQTCEECLWKAAFEALSQISLFLGKTNDTDKRKSYEITVLEKILSFLSIDDSVTLFPSRLEALYLVGSTDVDFMLRVMQELEHAIFSRFIEIHYSGEMRKGKVFIQLLNFYSGQVLPWCKRTERFEEVGKRFVDSVWDRIERGGDFKIGSEEKEISDALMMVIRLIVSGCRIENQVLIVQKTYKILSSEKLFSSEQLTFSSIRDTLKHKSNLNEMPHKHRMLISLSASVIIALDPKTPIPDSSMMLSFLMLHLLRGCSPAAQALGSLLNKWPSHGSTELMVTTLDEAIDFILDRGLLELCSLDLDESPILINGLHGLAWIGKGLLMRGHGKVERATCLLLNATSTEENTSAKKGQKVDNSIIVGRSAADAFHILLCDSEECLNKNFHATMRPLYKQRFFSSVMPSLVSLIKDCKSEITRSNLYCAFAHIISNTPLPAVINESMKIISFMPEALSLLSLDNQNKDLVYALLLVLSGIITVDKGREAAVENTPAIINCLVGLISYPHMMLVRETAVQCLMAISGLPHSRIYPFRVQVLRAVSRALGDIKRPVRLEAIKCRHTWSTMTSKDLHRR